jgi:hypothetical protein
MRLTSLLSLALLSVLPACWQFQVSAQAGYAQLSLDGDIGYLEGATSTAVAQDIESGLGLGEDQGTPYGRLAFNMGVPELSVSGFLFEDDGIGTLAQDFGEISANVDVATDLTMANAKAAYAFRIPLGPVTLAPGLALNYFDMDLDVQTVIPGAASVNVQAGAPLPMLFLRGEVDLKYVGLIAEVGYVSADVEDVEAEFLDIEALVEVRPLPWLNVFGGYRSIALDVEGELDDDSFVADLELSGFLFGGGVRF